MLYWSAPYSPRGETDIFRSRKLYYCTDFANPRTVENY